MEEKLQEALWCAHQLFARRLVRGSTGNISFRHENKIYISRSGSCFGRLSKEDFAVLSVNGQIVEGLPSKEYPLHLTFYRQDSETNAVIHTHSLFTTALSCMRKPDVSIQKLYSYTPYLRMLTEGKSGVAAYGPPGSKQLFDTFEKVFSADTRTYVLKNHGIAVGAKSAYKAFDIVEEFETSASLAAILESREEAGLRTI